MTATSLSGCGAVEAGALHANVSASTRVLQELRSRIVSLKLQPATILNRAELAKAATRCASICRAPSAACRS